MKKVLIIFLCSIFISHIAEAQFHRDNISLGIGPSLLYGENTGKYTKFRMNAMPSVSLSYSYDYAQHWDIRSTVGIQGFDGAGTSGPPLRKWLDNHQAYDAKGQAYYLDLMPVYQFNPIRPGKRKHMISYYAGLGLGVMHVQREVKIGMSAPPSEEGIRRYNTITEDQSTTALYFPARVGISTNLMRGWDFGIEGSTLIAASNNLDGNTTGHKRIKPDMLVQLQFMVKRNLGTW